MKNTRGEELPKFGPEGFDKIAIIGSAPSSIRLAPFKDPSWAIWGCSPGAYGACPRSDVWFEIHRWEPPALGVPEDAANKPWFSPEYAAWLQQHPCVIVAQPVASMANPWVYPFDEMIAKHGPYFFTSSVAWMLAMAVEMKPRAIGLWGIDMAASSEYAFQRPGCQHFIGLAMEAGIEVILPPESDLMRPSTLYGISEYDPMHIKLLARKRELEGRRNNAMVALNHAQNEKMFLDGAIDNLEYILQTWVNKVPTDLRMAVGKLSKGNPLIAMHQREVEIEAREPEVKVRKPRKPRQNGAGETQEVRVE